MTKSQRIGFFFSVLIGRMNNPAFCISQHEDQSLLIKDNIKQSETAQR
ncbi:hypothetical protein [Chlorobium phaeobacteroides]|jgi:hypothetical protein|nr:hypothetical protein [Chlorobium phaeobacteroides]